MMCQEGLSLCDMDLGPEKYRSNFEPLLPLLQDIAASPLGEMGTKIHVVLDNWGSLSSKKDNDIDLKLKQRASDLYTEIKDILFIGLF